ncbi:ribonuclease T2 family protein [Pseudomonas sp. LF245]|jgi:ribonuclease T2
MKSIRFVATALATLLISHGVQALDANEEITPSSAGFTYLVYAKTWQPSFCKLRPEVAGCDKPPQQFLTHGIWPYNDSVGQKTNRHPAFCNTAPSCQSTTACDISDAKLDQIANTPAIAQLVTVAPQGMFRHEWKKHGTCSGKTESDYFNDIVRLRKVGLYIEPMFDKWIGSSVTLAQMKNAFPTHASFRCFVLDGKQYLHEVFYSINPDGTPYKKDPSLQIGIPCTPGDIFIPSGA